MCSVDPSGEPRPATVSSGSDLLFGLLVCGLFAAAVGIGLAWSPGALRRPLLTPAAVGIGMGLLVARLGFPRCKTSLAVAALLPILALGLMHHQFFRRIEVAAAEQLLSHPAAISALELQNHLADGDSISGGDARRLRLAVSPEVSDYLIERMTPFLGEQPWPLSLGFMAIELLLAAGLAIAVFQKAALTPFHPVATPADRK
ncbi:MAG: hypothetical protein KDA75_14145 [Planctomycetaceae bacterium]|nr:hypothetical protein [Planctomycetaceae bacterium]